MLIAQGWVKLGGWMTGMWLPIVAGGATVLRELEDRPARLGRWKDKRHDVERQYQLDQERLIAKHEDMDRRRRCAAAAAGATCVFAGGTSFCSAAPAVAAKCDATP